MQRRFTILKLTLFVFAIVVAFALYAASQYLIKEIKENEKTKITLWSQALQNKSTVLAETETLFRNLAIDEQVKVELWSYAMQKLLQDDISGDVQLLVKIISSNRNIPIVLVNSSDRIVSSVNIDFELPQDSVFSDSLKSIFSKHEPMVLENKHLPRSYLYYQDSRLHKSLQEILDEYVESLVSDIVENSLSVPVVVADSSSNTIFFSGNVDSTVLNDSIALHLLISDMLNENDPIPVHLYDSNNALVLYKDSYILDYVKFLPYAVLSVLGLFVFASFLAFNASRKHDQNQIWVGMSKETAHQLGTPISSLIAWVELLKLLPDQVNVAEEINKDVSRLKTIADRFSKIGSEPKLQELNIFEVCEKSVAYMQRRTSSSVAYTLENNVSSSLNIPLSEELFEWCIENLIRNAVDAMAGKGKLNLCVSDNSTHIILDISDSGKGISRSKFKSVFKPGYTTKSRGWGLGLSLTKRIIEEFHSGRIFVKASELEHGTTFRILLPKAVTNRK